MLHFFVGFLLNTVFIRPLGLRASTNNAHASGGVYFKQMRAKNGTNRTGFKLLQFKLFDSRCYGSTFHWSRAGFGIFILFITILWLCLKTRFVYEQYNASLDKFSISYEVAILPERMCWIWIFF